MKFFISVFALILPLTTFAAVKTYSLIPGQTISLDAADASNQDGEIHLSLQVLNPSGKAVDPQAHVVEAEAGFECRVQRVILNHSRFDSETKTFHQEYLLKVSWLPGGDQSHCALEITHPSVKPAKAVIFMDWQGG